MSAGYSLRRDCCLRLHFGQGETASQRVNCYTLGFATPLKARSLLQKELGQKDRLLQQHQAKMEEALRKLSEASYQQVGTFSATELSAL